MKKINIGIVGLGIVGSGVVELLRRNRNHIADRTGVDIKLAKAADVDVRRKQKLRLADSVFTKNADDILNDKNIDIIIELVGGTGFAKDLVLNALRKGKSVVTANKALLGEHGDRIFAEAARNNVRVGFEASVGGGIPIIRALRHGLVANRINSIFGIVNGTSNYILTKMEEEGKIFKDALSEAQEKGYAEKNPYFDVEGIDSANKLAILCNLGFGTNVKSSEIYTEGITHVTEKDIRFAKEEFGYVIKLLAIVKKAGSELDVRVHPTMLPDKHLLASVKNEFNAIYVNGDFTGPTIFYGKGAGSAPTASAIVSDIVDIALTRTNIREDLFSDGSKLKIKDINEIVSRYYIRFYVEDRAGVLARIGAILGENQISISSIIQAEWREKNAVPIVMLTHDAKESNMRRALKELNKLPAVKSKVMFIRIEKGE